MKTSLPSILWPAAALLFWAETVPAQSPPPLASEIFIDGSRPSGIDFLHRNSGYAQKILPDIMGGGAALLDVDQDGDLDVYLTQARLLGETQEGPPLSDQLYLNVTPPGGKLRFHNATAKAGISATGFGMGVACGDVDNDGYPDLYVTNWGSNQLWMNKGDGTFREATSAAGVDDPRFSTSASFFDYDRDGDLDLFVANYVDMSLENKVDCFADNSAPDYCGPDAYDPVSDRLFRNKGDGTFEDVTSTAGISQAFGAGLGVVTADLNGDGWIDIYVANDGDPNQLWINQKDGTFLDEALLAGVALNATGKAEAGMGVDVSDFDGDGDLDIFVTHLMEESNTLYINRGQGFFEDDTIASGLHLPSLSFTAFGTAFLDYDNDGHPDLLSLNGAVRIDQKLKAQGDSFPLGQPNQLFRNLGDGRFSEVSRQAGAAFQLAEVSRGAALGDVDNDGDVDLLVGNVNGPARLLLNQVGSDRAWIGLRLLGAGERDQLGAQVTLRPAEGAPLVRQSRTDGSYCSCRDARVLAGLGTRKGPVSVEVLWPDGRVESFGGLQINRYHTLRQGSGEGKPSDPAGQ
ncbi:MAG TPA: CRTAC1 family protein [Acidobacteriota bacterium]|nr:CRTAC1 family protein [Acidobacteriota bacterium]